MDSEYDVSDGDDDLYEDEVSDVEGEERKLTILEKATSSNSEKGKKVAEPDDLSEDDDMFAPDSDEDTVKMKFNTFREEDMHKPCFKTGQVFDSVQLLRRAIKEYSCQNRVDIKFPVNGKARLCGKCSGQSNGNMCPWYLWASQDSRTKCFMIKRFEGEHTCSKLWKLNAFTSRFIAEKYVASFRVDENMNLKNFSRIVQKDWNMQPSRSKLQRARKIAMDVIYGDEVGQYKLLWDYANEIRTSNPGSTFYLALDKKSRFKQCYVSLDACKRGFLQGCRPVLFLDGCHIKTRYRGQFLTAVGMDPNDCIYPIAFGVVEVEDTQSWGWFLETLKQDLGIENTYPWTIMSDKQKGLIKAVQEHLPNSEHRFCVRHMWQNFQQLFEGEVLKTMIM